MQEYVEFYFPGVSLMGRNERKVSSRDADLAHPFPEYAYAFRFFQKDEEGNKVNFSDFHYIGEEYDEKQFKQAFPQGGDLKGRIVKLITGGFIEIGANEIVTI